jgi:serine/threonine protein kinase
MIKYKKVREIGKGSFGRVFLVQEKKKRELFCMKTMYKWKKFIKGTMRDYFRTEVEAMKKMNHKNVIKYVEHFQTKNYFCIVMEYAKDGDMFDLTSSKMISEEMVREFFWQIINGVEHIHSMGYFHRDLKLENILLHNGVIKICDFGLAAKTNNKEKIKGSVGTTDYVSPQVISRQPYDGVKNDIWSLGVILFIMCSILYPFGNNIPLKMISRKIKYSVPSMNLMKFHDMNLDFLVKNMLEKKEKKRISFKKIKENTWLNNQRSP